MKIDLRGHHAGASGISNDELARMMAANNEAGDGSPEWSHVRHGAGVLVAIPLSLVIWAMIYSWSDLLMDWLLTWQNAGAACVGVAVGILMQGRPLSSRIAVIALLISALAFFGVVS